MLLFMIFSKASSGISLIEPKKGLLAALQTKISICPNCDLVSSTKRQYLQLGGKHGRVERSEPRRVRARIQWPQSNGAAVGAAQSLLRRHALDLVGAVRLQQVERGSSVPVLSHLL